MGFGYGSGGGNGGATYNVGATQGYGYTTLTSSVDAPTSDGRTYVSSVTRGYSMLTGGRPQLNRRYTPPSSASAQRRKSLAAQVTTKNSAAQAVSAPSRTILDKIYPQPQTLTPADNLRREVPHASRRKSHANSRPQARNERSRKKSTNKKPTENKPSSYRYSFSSAKSTRTAKSAGSRRSTSSRRGRKKSTSGYGLWSCLGF